MASELRPSSSAQDLLPEGVAYPQPAFFDWVMQRARDFVVENPEFADEFCGISLKFRVAVNEKPVLLTMAFETSTSYRNK